MDVLVIGGSGQLGQVFNQLINTGQKKRFVFPTSAELDITSEDAVNCYLDSVNPTIIINFSAYTNVEQAEDSPEAAHAVNVDGPYYLAKYASQNNVKLIHVSTDYVFDGEGSIPYTEEIQTGPINVYGASKLAGEQKILSVMKNNALIIRTSWLYSIYGKNFVKTILAKMKQEKELKVVNDQIGSLTLADDLANAILLIVSSEMFNAPSFNSEIFHFSNEGACSWYDVSCSISALLNIDCEIRPVDSKMFPTKAQRPSFSVMNKAKFSKAFNTHIRHWCVALQECLLELEDLKK